MFELTSPDFTNGGMIPQLYSCDGEDTSPKLIWKDPPQGTKSFALIMDDPDAPMGTWVHWIIFNIPPEKLSLPRAVSPEMNLPDGSQQGRNSWHQISYGGPCPPSGTHRYLFKLYALATILDLEAGADKATLVRAMEKHILKKAELMGLFKRD
ncbi:MAG TPA: YbhB/YbcL family Raf kinase inhibitor-like protein [Anaerolineae bacterium]|nr:YbhB/YbcL family Raf kinase inhibitor-like protein [Anaerolineae bacterium]